MKNRTAIVMIMALIIPQLLLAFDKNDAKERVKQIKAWLTTFEYARAYEIDSEDALEKAILFIEDPIKNFRLTSGMDMHEFWGNCYLYDTFMEVTKKAKSGMYFGERLDAITQEMNDKKVNVMTFLVLNCFHALYPESLRDLYMNLFDHHIGLFITHLKKRGDWKRIVDEVYWGSPNRMRWIIINLGNSDFEKEFKEHAFARYPFLKEYVDKKWLARWSQRPGRHGPPVE